MTYRLALDSAWSKFERGCQHVRAFRAAVESKLGAHPIYYQLRREYDADMPAITWKIEGLVDIDGAWSLIVADAISNFRCSLDHLAWQLAIRHLDGAEPEGKAASKIHFPIAKKRDAWPKAYVDRFDGADLIKLEKHEAFNADPIAHDRELPHPLLMLQKLSNTDKHRQLQLTYAYPAVFSWIDYTTVRTRDCRMTETLKYKNFPDPPRLGDTVIIVPIEVLGPDPDIDLQPSLSCFVAIRDRWNVDDVLAMIEERVESILREFAGG